MTHTILINGKPDQGLNEVEPGSEVVISCDPAGVSSFRLSFQGFAGVAGSDIEICSPDYHSVSFKAPTGRHWALLLSVSVNNGYGRNGQLLGDQRIIVGSSAPLPSINVPGIRDELLLRVQAFTTAMSAANGVGISDEQFDWLQRLSGDLGIMPPIRCAPVDPYVRAGLDLMRRLLS